MVKKIVLHAVIAALLASVFVACEEAEQDPYATVTLREATRGMVVSKGFKYKLENPKIEMLSRNLGLIREGDLLEFISGRSLEDRLQGKTDGNFALAVVKEFSPYVHFKVEKIYTDIDTTFLTQAGAIVYPRIFELADYGTEAFEEQDIDAIPYNRTGTLRGLVDKKIKVMGTVTKESEEGREFYMLHGANSKFRIADAADGTDLFLRLFAEKGYPFEGGIIMTEVEDYGPRMRSKIAGTVQIQYLRYNTKIITG